MSDPVITAVGVSKRFGDVKALDECDLTVPSGAVMTLLGPSGSGKSTMLRIIAGFDRPERGTVDIRGRRVVGPEVFVPPEQRRVGVVLQDYALFPHLDVAGNVGYGLARDRDRSRRIDEVVELVGLTGLRKRYPHELSGGQQQRVALARALAPSPDLVILDEPFSNLDEALRGQVRRDIIEVIRNASATALFITHDQEEALSMSDLVAVMNAGRIVQTAPPQVLYWEPANEWIASFVGDANFVSGRAHGGTVETALGTFPCDADGDIVMMIRPEEVGLSLANGNGGEATVRSTEFFGHDQLVTVAYPDGTTIRSRLGPDSNFSPGQHVVVHIESTTCFPR
jgi:iron(III) transport system ATP-binding protein